MYPYQNEWNEVNVALTTTILISSRGKEPTVQPALKENLTL